MKKLITLLIILTFIAGFTACGEGANIDTEDGTAAWKMPLGTIYNSGTSPFSPEPPMGIVWEKELPNTTQFSPVAASTVVIITDDKGNIYCLSQETGSVIWSKNYGNTGFQAVIGRNRIFLGNDSQEMLALDIKNGNTIWQQELEGNVVGWALLDAGKLWFVTEHDLYCLEETKGGVVYHKSFIKETFTHAPSLQKYLYLVAGKKLIAFNDFKHEEVWSIYFEKELLGPVTCQRSNIYAVDSRLFKIDDKNGDVLDSFAYYAPNPAGEIIKESDSSVDLLTTASIYANVICTTTEHGNVIALTDSNNGIKFLWSLGVTFPTSSPVIVGSEYVYFGASDGRIYVGSTADGRWIWHNRFGEKEDTQKHQFNSTPAVLVDRIFMVSTEGLIKRFSVGGRPMTFEQMSE